jgi:RimJ/RimL family protein N-acetyltransferase
VELLTARLRLRPFSRDDLPAFVAYRARPEVALYQSWTPAYSMTDAERFYSEQKSVAFGRPGEWVQLAIEDRVTGALCGDCAVKLLDTQPATAELGVTLDPGHQSCGIATEALSMVVGHLINDLDLHRVYAETDDRNTAVHRLFDRLDFRREARLVEADWHKGEWTTVIIHGLLGREWKGLGGPASQ